MSKHQTIDVPYVAQLARLNLSMEEISKFQPQLNEMLSYVEQLSRLQVEGIEPTAHATLQTNVFRADQIFPSLKTNEVLGNAPKKLNDLFILPKVVE